MQRPALTTKLSIYVQPDEILLDQGIPRSTVEQLHIRGIDTEHVGQLSMAMALDEDNLKAAVNRNAVIVTLDADFHALLATT